MKPLTEKVLFLGIDAMDPRVTKKFIDEGIMPNMEKLLKRGACSTDMAMIGGEPTVTPPMWATMATGASPKVHGITAYGRSFDDLKSTGYNFDSARCKAEQLWNVTSAAGKKTLVWHWPGGAWPPSSESENLYVVDGTQPGGPNGGVAVVDAEKLVIANVKTEVITYREKAATDSKVPCLIDDLEVSSDEGQAGHSIATAKRTTSLTSWKNPPQAMKLMAAPPQDVSFSPITDAHGWLDAPADAKEFTILNSKGLIRRPCLLIQHEGQYDTIQIYKNKKETEPIVELKEDIYVEGVVDEVYKGDDLILANRNMRVLEIAADGSSVRMWMSNAMDFHNNTMWSPGELLEEIVENVGYPQPVSTIGGEEKLIRGCTMATWDAALDWNADSLNYLIAHDEFEVVFSHFHNIDLQGHMMVRFLKDGSERLPAEVYQQLFREVYLQTDRYIGKFLHLLDEGWSILLISDHGQACPEHGVELSLICDGAVNATHMVDWGFTVLTEDENGKEIVDMSQSKAVMNNTGFIWINLKGRNPEGIVEPEDQYELEEQIITKLYSLTNEKTGHRMIALALRNRDAAVIGEGGPEAGDIIYKLAEGYNQDHADALSTTHGFFDTSINSIFVAAGSGIKENFKTERTIRSVDVAPTGAVLLGLKAPAQCEGAPVYQIFADAEI